MNNITDLQPSGLLTFRADESCSHRNGQNLTSFVRVPVCSSTLYEVLEYIYIIDYSGKSQIARRTRSEANVVAHAIFCIEDGIHMDCSRECFCWLSGCCVGFVRTADELHGFGRVAAQCLIKRREMKRFENNRLQSFAMEVPELL